MSSSRFVSGGTIDNPVERDDEWLKAQQEIEANRLRKEEEGRQEGGKSLYEVLQANKAAKQEAFEESIKLKNQFRTLDDDEAEFINSVLESTREKEAAIRKETAEQLEVFRRHQEEAEKAARAEQDTASPTAEDEQWIASGRKRKKGYERAPLKGLKLRKSSSTSEPVGTAKKDSPPHTEQSATASAASKVCGKWISTASPQGGASLEKEKTVKQSFPPIASSTTVSAPVSSPPVASKPGSLLLANYSSDENE